MVTIPRVIGAFVFALLAMTGVFVWRYSDLLYLRQPVASIEHAGRQAFTDQVALALARPDLTRRHLDTIADAAARFGDLNLEALALMRRQEQDPDDLNIRLRLADALRRAGNYARAEELFRAALSTTGGDAR